MTKINGKLDKETRIEMNKDLKKIWEYKNLPIQNARDIAKKYGITYQAAYKAYNKLDQKWNEARKPIQEAVK